MRRTTWFVLFLSIFGAMIVSAAQFWGIIGIANSILNRAKTDIEVVAGFLLYPLAFALAITIGFGIPLLSFSWAKRKMTADPSEEE